MTEYRKTTLTNYVGFESIKDQVYRKIQKRGFNFNLMVVGRSGLGKSTMVNTLFATHLVDSKKTVGKTTEIATVSHLVEEKGVSLKLSITDTPGYGDQVNNEQCWEPIVKYIKDQYSLFLRKELTPQRELRINDSRVHCVLFFIAPTGHALTPLDITVMKKISRVANLVPVIAKSDSLTLDERVAFKKRIKQELDFHGVRVYPWQDMDEEFYEPGTEEERSGKQAFLQLRDVIPFCVVGSENRVVVDGKAVPARRTRYGVINAVEDPNHCEFIQLRNFLLRTHMQDLIESTALVHYETFRTRQLLALKESTSVKHDDEK
ncbi:Septin-type guanine nucleotide-binding (G) domain-containing protein [Gorgonomyces haynaldii]|nr:Septin-type guanine nucleotide-binding (G) domain-containing protein [Gorgonomyces haynaldii]